MKLLRKIMGGISLTAAMFVFQACYGTDEDYYDYESRVTFRITSEDTGKPLPSIRIISREITSESGSIGADYTESQETTDTNGIATMWGTKDRPYRFAIVDDSSRYAAVDTVLFPIEVDTVNIALKLKP